MAAQLLGPFRESLGHNSKREKTMKRSFLLFLLLAIFGSATAQPLLADATFRTVPEPSSLLLLVPALLGLGLLRSRFLK